MGIAKKNWQELSSKLEGEVHLDTLHRAIYSTDASVYREYPIAVVVPKTIEDIRQCIVFCREHELSIIPRATGTSISGQCTGSGVVVDVSKYFTKILDINVEEKWAWVQCGIIRDELNYHLTKHGVFFAPETSTSSRATIGGMVGNNSSGANSIAYGVTRDHILSLKCFLSDGSYWHITKDTWTPLMDGQSEELKNVIVAYMKGLCTDELEEKIHQHFPKKSIHRRNNGYAIDDFIEHTNYVRFLCGSEGSLVCITEIQLQLVDIPTARTGLWCPQFSSLFDALEAVELIMKHTVFACELMDKAILDCTKDSLEYVAYRFFINQDPEALLMVELRDAEHSTIENQVAILQSELEKHQLGYSYPLLLDSHEIQMAWKLRKAGLGLLSNIKSHKKAVAVVEDTAVAVEDLSQYIKEFAAIMEGFKQQSIYYAHAGAGELHLRPMLDLKDPKDCEDFMGIAQAVAELVKKYNGSLSGEHGDGRVRAPFLGTVVGEEMVHIFENIKQVWDASHLFNPGKIVFPKPVLSDLRTDQAVQISPTSEMDFSDAGGYLEMTEKCNGTGQCRNLSFSGGTMCPSYRATRDEKHSTRARANILREFIGYTQEEQQKTKVSEKEVMEALDLCLSCKGCKFECPSLVDVSALKAEWYHQYYQKNGIPWRTKIMGENAKINKLFQPISSLYNSISNTTVVKKILDIHEDRSVPQLQSQTLRQWVSSRKKSTETESKKVYFFVDEFTNYYDVDIGKKAILFLEKLGYKVEIVQHPESGRALLSKGLLKKAKKIVDANMAIFDPLITDETPLIGLEPSCILSFRDEYIRLATDRHKAQKLAKNSFLLEEFITSEYTKGNIDISIFSANRQSNILFHGHCHQKSLSSTSHTLQILSWIGKVEEIPSGCCGMAGSFGYEKEHYTISNQIGELVLFPAIRNNAEAEVCAIGTSCRHQILDATHRNAKHWVEFFIP